MILPPSILEAPTRVHRVVELQKWMDEFCAVLASVCTVGEICNALDAASRRVADGQRKKRKGANGRGAIP